MDSPVDARYLSFAEQVDRQADGRQMHLWSHRGKRELSGPTQSGTFCFAAELYPSPETLVALESSASLKCTKS